MSKIKMRCTTCGKWFQSANAKEVTCPDCVQKARKEKLAAKTASSKTPGQTAQGTANLSRPSPPPPPKPKPAPGSTSHWFDKVEDIKVGEPEQPQRPKLPPSPAPRDTRGGPERPGNRGPGGYRDERGPGRYRAERGIRTQISKELSIPKKAIKKSVKDLRDRQDIPSWWEIQSYKGDAEELEKIKAAYEPYLPLPPVGVHKTIAEQLELKPGVIYQAIKAIRLEMNLPQYNDPALHSLELAPKKKKEQSAVQEAEPVEAATQAAGPTHSQEEQAEVTSATAPTPGETSPATTAADTPADAGEAATPEAEATTSQADQAQGTQLT